MTFCIHTLLLAAGVGHRFGTDKRFHTLRDGVPLWRHALDNLLSGCTQVTVVIRPGESSRFKPLLPTGVTLYEAQEARSGMGASLASAVRHIESTAPNDGIVIALADMPFIAPSTVRQIATALVAHPIVIPTFNRQRGHPVGFQRRFFSEICQLDGDIGARQIIRQHSASVHELTVNDPGILQDIDTPADIRGF